LKYRAFRQLSKAQLKFNKVYFWYLSIDQTL
jgi:hypothetical protein